jgi:hypothetical protein
MFLAFKQDDFLIKNFFLYIFAFLNIVNNSLGKGSVVLYQHLLNLYFKENSVSFYVKIDELMEELDCSYSSIQQALLELQKHQLINVRNCAAKKMKKVDLNINFIESNKDNLPEWVLSFGK